MNIITILLIILSNKYSLIKISRSSCNSQLVYNEKEKHSMQGFKTNIQYLRWRSKRWLTYSSKRCVPFSRNPLSPTPVLRPSAPFVFHGSIVRWKERNASDWAKRKGVQMGGWSMSVKPWMVFWGDFTDFSSVVGVQRRQGRRMAALPRAGCRLVERNGTQSSLPLNCLFCFFFLFFFSPERPCYDSANIGPPAGNVEIELSTTWTGGRKRGDRRFWIRSSWIFPRFLWKWIVRLEEKFSLLHFDYWIGFIIARALWHEYFIFDSIFFRSRKSYECFNRLSVLFK